MVTNRRKWAVGSNQFVKRSGRALDPAASPASRPLPDINLALPDSMQKHDTGITWGELDFSPIKASGIERARHRFRESLPDLVWNAAALEGNAFTLPEVRTLLEGVTVGGKRLEDEEQILALSEGYSALDEMVGAGDFTLDKATSDILHGLVARHEAIEAGSFRGEGRATGGGGVRLANGGSVSGFEHGQGGAHLRNRLDTILEHLEELEDARERALAYFSAATRTQFYFDGNKRTARLMMTGALMTAGYDPINIPYARRLEFNHALDRLFTTDDATELMTFLISCAD